MGYCKHLKTLWTSFTCPETTQCWEMLPVCYSQSVVNIYPSFLIIGMIWYMSFPWRVWALVAHSDDLLGNSPLLISFSVLPFWSPTNIYGNWLGYILPAIKSLSGNHFCLGLSMMPCGKIILFSTGLPKKKKNIFEWDEHAVCSLQNPALQPTVYLGVRTTNLRLNFISA